MFGEYEFYSDGKYIGLICNNNVFVKTSKQLVAKVGDDGQRAYEGSKNSLHIPEEMFEDRELLKQIFNLI